MREATAINVQSMALDCFNVKKLNRVLLAHVEEFKKAMSREVYNMTQEVANLQRERQVIEHQLSELFALLAKQKRALVVSKPLNSYIRMLYFVISESNSLRRTIFVIEMLNLKSLRDRPYRHANTCTCF